MANKPRLKLTVEIDARDYPAIKRALNRIAEQIDAGYDRCTGISDEVDYEYEVKREGND